MWQPQIMLRYALVLCAFFALNVHAAKPNPAAEAKESQAWLRKIQSAAQNLNYSGTFVYQQASQVRTSRIAHIVEGKNEIEKLEVLDGKPREYVRRNDEITYYAPESKTLLVERRIIKDIFPSILTTNPGKLSSYYILRMGQSERVAGYATKAIVLKPKDRFRYGYKLWAERSTGLLLRVQTTNEKGDVLEQIAFTQLAIGDVPDSKLAPSVSDTRGWRVENTVMTQISKSNWKVKALPPGFKKVREMKRLLTNSSGSDAKGSKSAASSLSRREVSQMVFSDGLATVSVFAETAGANRTEGAMHQGAMNILSKRQGSFWLTIVGEVPSATIRQIANSIEFKPDK
ncbi:MucB/RseB C-terminal domain-containing protein [Oxalobacteraceae bacterium R-40]|uniref:MucB/RseB C-terminal domain-containing protein n=1 Tax=Keguizhuia sedimenti TaxID=3064264 RepID=A0ABU1BP59_9BURK|nr:MucB/RseB C-terminal domain-containing protein [Oxalobacteraceae bacterium R-40]